MNAKLKFVADLLLDVCNAEEERADAQATDGGMWMIYAGSAIDWNHLAELVEEYALQKA